jgi:hypothetical protein
MTDLAARCDAALAELAELRSALAEDGYGLEADGVDDTRLNLRIVVTSADACADCLVPEPVLRQIIAARLTETGLQPGTISYPPAGQEAH